MRGTVMTGGIALAAALLVATGPPRAAAVEGGTMQALEIAFQREVSARLHYLAFANAARLEGFPEVGALFIAIARAESAHARNHSRVIEARGGSAVPETASVAVRSTEANLRDSIENEHKEDTLIYIVLANIAREEADTDALATFNYARGAEATHRRMFQAAFDHLNEVKVTSAPIPLPTPGPTDGEWSPEPNEPVAFVCPECGCVFDTRPRHSCRCGNSGAKYLAFASQK